MSILSQTNEAIAALLPAETWDALQIVMGLLVFFGTFVQRVYNERFHTSSISCSVDAITVRGAQIGLALIGTVAFLLVIDAIMPGNSPPRSLVIVFMGAYFMLQIRVIHTMLIAHRKKRMSTA
jgi:hypothetical protein